MLEYCIQKDILNSRLHVVFGPQNNVGCFLLCFFCFVALAVIVAMQAASK